MEDRQTGSVWTHYDGQVLTGPLAHDMIELPIQPMIHTTWGDWLDQYPEALVLDWYEEYAHRYFPVQPGTGGIGQPFLETILNWDDRLGQSELVLGVVVGDEARAYVMADLPVGRSVIIDELGGEPVVVFADGNSNYALAYSPVVDGTVLDFSAANAGWYSGDGTEWDAGGVAIAGPLTGTRLDFVTSFVTEWYGWAAYHPNTTIYGAS